MDDVRWVVLLRGVNIGGVRFRMTDLTAALTERGYADVRSVLASGNLLLTAEGDEPAAVAEAVHAVIHERFGFDVAALAVPVPLVRTAVEQYPFPRGAARQAYVVFAERTAALAELLDSGGPLDPAVEQVATGEGVLYWDAPKGETLTTAFGKHYGARQRSGAVTTRNLNTLEKILEVA